LVRDFLIEISRRWSPLLRDNNFVLTLLQKFNAREICWIVAGLHEGNYFSQTNILLLKQIKSLIAQKQSTESVESDESDESDAVKLFVEYFNQFQVSL
jgi:hypothetical protein